jgi:hypothetical protein
MKISPRLGAEVETRLHQIHRRSEAKTAESTSGRGKSKSLFRGKRLVGNVYCPPLISP